MFIGHYSTALVAKAIAPKAPFWVFILAVQLVDVAWALFVMFGIEGVRFDTSLASNPLDLYHMPYSHSLVATLVWSLGTFVVLRTFARHYLSVQEATVIALVVASHWVADVLVHRPDLLIWGDLKIGLGLWDYPVWSMLLEVGVVVLALVFLLSRDSFNYRIKRSMLIFGIILVMLQLSILVIPPPLQVVELSLTGLLFFLGLPLLAWAMVDRKSRLNM
ncbi:MAG: hypothetical protein R3183_00425 [Oleiphilaceae bacterium]|nr:hypothetical protein [Oleiphilaceae bacterium]